jgi:hypothetical protein
VYWPRQRHEAHHLYPADAGDSADDEAFAEHHPIVRHLAVTGDGGAVRTSGVIRPSQWERLALYQTFFGPLGIREQLACGRRRRR